MAVASTGSNQAAPGHPTALAHRSVLPSPWGAGSRVRGPRAEAGSPRGGSGANAWKCGQRGPAGEEGSAVLTRHGPPPAVTEDARLPHLVFLAAAFLIVLEDVVTHIILRVDEKLLCMALLLPPLHPPDEQQDHGCGVWGRHEQGCVCMCDMCTCVSMLCTCVHWDEYGWAVHCESMHIAACCVHAVHVHMWICMCLHAQPCTHVCAGQPM